MTLSLPEDAERFLLDGHDFDRLYGAAVYCLRLSRPDNLPEVWDQHFDTRPDEYWEDLTDADGVLYVGCAKDVLSRLTDHKDGDKRVTVLTEICSIDGLRNIWWVERRG